MTSLEDCICPHRNVCIRACLKRGINRDDAEDIAQIAMLEAVGISKREGLKREGIPALLNFITQRILRTPMRKNRMPPREKPGNPYRFYKIPRSSGSSLDDLDMDGNPWENRVPDYSTPEKEFFDNYISPELQNEMKAIPYHCREAILISATGLTGKQAAHFYGINFTTYNKHLGTARRLLKSQMCGAEA